MIKASELLPVVVELANLRPDMESGCFYFKDDGQPCCIVGHGLAALGADPAHYLNTGHLNDQTPVLELAQLFEEIEDDDNAALKALDSIQRYQDKGKTWGEALALSVSNPLVWERE